MRNRALFAIIGAVAFVACVAASGIIGHGVGFGNGVDWADARYTQLNATADNHDGANVSDDDELSVSSNQVDDDFGGYDYESTPWIDSVDTDCAPDGSTTIYGHVTGLDFDGYYDIAVDTNPFDQYVNDDTWAPLISDNVGGDDFDLNVNTDNPVTLHVVDFDRNVLDTWPADIDTCRPTTPPATQIINVTPVCDDAVLATGQIMFDVVNPSNEPMDMFVSFVDANGNVDPMTYYSYYQEVPVGHSSLSTSDFGYGSLTPGSYTITVDMTDSVNPAYSGFTQNSVTVKSCDNYGHTGFTVYVPLNYVGK